MTKKFYIPLSCKKQKIKSGADIHDLCYLLQQRTDNIVCLINYKNVDFFSLNDHPKSLYFVKKINKDNYIVYVFKDNFNTYCVYNRINAKIFGYEKFYKKPIHKITNNETMRLKTMEETITIKKPKIFCNYLQY